MMLGEVLVRFGAETSGLMGGINQASGGLMGLLNPVNLVKGALGQIASGTGNLAFGFRNLGTAGTVGMDAIKLGQADVLQGLMKLGAAAIELTAIFALVGVAIAAAIGYKAVTAAADFQQGLSRLKTGAGDVTDNMAKMGQSILQVSTATGVMTGPLLQAMYQIISAGQRGAQAEDTLSVAAKGAVAEQANVVDVAKAVSGAMTDYGTKQYNATQFMNGMTRATQLGKVTLEQLSTSMGPLMPIAANLGIKYSDLAGAMSTMTNAGLPADRAATSLRFTMQSLENPTKKAKDEMSALGLNSVAVGNELKVSLPGALQMIYDAAKRAGPEGSVPFNRAVADMIGGQRSLSAFMALTGGHFKTFVTDTNEVKKAMDGSKTAVLGWDTAQKNFNVQMDRGKAAVNALFINIGTALLPVLTQLVSNIVPIVTRFADWVTRSNAVENALKAIAPIAQAIGAGFMLVLPMIIQLWTAFVDVVRRTSTWLQQNQGFMEALKYTVIALGVAIGVILLAALVVVVAAFAAIVIAIVVVVAIVQSFIAAGRAAGDVWQRSVAWIVDQWNFMVSAAVDVWGRIGAAWNAGVAFVSGIVSGFVNAIINFFNFLAHNLVGGSIVPDMINAIVQWFAQLPGRVMGAIQALLGLVVGFFVGLGNQVRALVTALISAVVTIFSQLPGRAVAAVQSLAGLLGNFFSGLANQALSWGGNIINNLASGIRGAIGAVAGAIGDVTSFIAAHLPHSPAKLGPLRDLDKSGEEIVRQLSAGMGHAKPTLSASLTQVIGSPTTGTAGGPPAANEMITLLRSIDQKLDSGRPYSRYELTQALGLLLADGVRR